MISRFLFLKNISRLALPRLREFYELEHCKKYQKVDLIFEKFPASEIVREFPQVALKSLVFLSRSVATYSSHFFDFHSV